MQFRSKPFHPPPPSIVFTEFNQKTQANALMDSRDGLAMLNKTVQIYDRTAFFATTTLNFRVFFEQTCNHSVSNFRKLFHEVQYDSLYSKAQNLTTTYSLTTGFLSFSTPLPNIYFFHQVYFKQYFWFVLCCWLPIEHSIHVVWLTA